jgi:hypothetical protein
MKLELLTNATVVDDAIRFVASSHQNGYHQQHILSEGEEKLKITVAQWKISNILQR